MLEYLERPEENKKGIMSDGYIRTGDLGKYNKDGRFIFIDRIKALIK